MSVAGNDHGDGSSWCLPNASQNFDVCCWVAPSDHGAVQRQQQPVDLPSLPYAVYQLGDKSFKCIVSHDPRRRGVRDKRWNQSQAELFRSLKEPAHFVRDCAELSLDSRCAADRTLREIPLVR